jgi:hypothetical protein
LAFGDAELEVFEEGWDAREEADALDASGFGLIEECTYEEATGSVPFRLGIDHDGANLGEVLAIDVERGTTNEIGGAVLNDGEGADVLADLHVGATEEGAVVGATVD